MEKSLREKKGEKIHPRVDRALILVFTKGRTSFRREDGEEILGQRRQRGRPG